MALQVSAPQLHGQISEPPGTVLKTQTPAVQLLLWQVLQQLQSIDPSKNQYTTLVNELQMEKLRTRQERRRREDFEEEAYKEINKLRNEKKLSTIDADGVMLELEVKKSRLETLEKQHAEERNFRIKLEIESDKCKVKLKEEQDLNMLMGQQLQNEKEKCEEESESKKSLKEEIIKLESQLYEKQMSYLNVQRELSNELVHVRQLEETLRNETMKRMTSEHEYLKQILEFKNQISILTGKQDLEENTKKLCDVAQENLIEERDKVSKLKDELSDLRTDLFKLNIELGYEKKAVSEFKDLLQKEINRTETLKNELDLKRNKVKDLENEIDVVKKQLSDEKIQKDDLEKKLEEGRVQLNVEINKFMELKSDLDAETQRVKELEGKLHILNGTDLDMHGQRLSLEKKLKNLTKDLNAEQATVKILKEKLDNEAKEIKVLKRKLEIERDFNDQEKERRQSAEKDLEKVKQLYVKCGGNDGLSQIHRAAKVCDLAETKSLMRNGYSASEATKGNYTWKTPVHLAVEAGCTDLVHLFALNKTLINIWDENGSTPLHVAAQYTNMNIVRVLLDLGAAVNAWDKFGKTPLDYAGTNSNAEVMKLLIDRGGILGSAREFGPTTAKNEKDDSDDYNYYY